MKHTVLPCLLSLAMLSAATPCTDADVRSLQRYLLRQSDQAGDYDLNGDGCLDVYDLALMKRACLQGDPALSGLSYAEAVAGGYISRSEYPYQITGALRDSIEAQLGRRLDFSADRFYPVTGAEGFLYDPAAGMCFPVTAETPRTRAAWYWRGQAAQYGLDDDPAQQEAFLDALEWYGITELYYSMGANKLVKDPAVPAALIRRAYERDMRVYLVAGENTWLHEDSYETSISRIFDRVTEYNAMVAPEERLAGVSYDAEVWTNAAYDWKNSEATRAAHLAWIREAQACAGAHDLGVSFCLPFWLVRYDCPEPDGSRRNMLEAVMETANDVILMAYRDTPEAVEKLILQPQTGTEHSVLYYAEQTGCSLEIAVQADENKEGDFVSFYEEELAEPGCIRQAVAAIEADLSGAACLFTFAIHHAVMLFEVWGRRVTSAP